MISDGLGQLARQYRVDLDGRDLGTPIEQGQCQGAETGTDLKNMVMTIDPGSRDDTANGVGVMYEVLAERLAWPEINLFSEMSYLGGPQNIKNKNPTTLQLQ